MSNPVSSQPGQKPSLERSGIRRIVQVLVSILLIGVLLFLSAGRLDWLWGWLFLAGWLLLILPSAVVMSKSPDLINERGRRADNIKGWDKVLMGTCRPKVTTIRTQSQKCSCLHTAIIVSFKQESPA